MSTGWLGLYQDAFKVLAKAGADIVKSGGNSEGFAVSKTSCYHVEGYLTVGLGGQELVIQDGAIFFVDGKPQSFLEALKKSPGGVVLGVI
jgi:hypothetical protein